MEQWMKKRKSEKCSAELGDFAEGSVLKVMTAHTKANIKQRVQVADKAWTLDENFAKLCHGKQKAFYEWMLSNGIPFKGRTLTRVEADWLQTKVSRRLFTPRQCVLQSQMGVMDGELRYFEGQANTKSLGLPLEHAWLVDKDGKVWDATWKDGDDYFGVEIPRDFVRTNVFATGEAQFLLAKWYGTQIIERLKAQ